MHSFREAEQMDLSSRDNKHELLV